MHTNNGSNIVERAASNKLPFRRSWCIYRRRCLRHRMPVCAFSFKLQDARRLGLRKPPSLRIIYATDGIVSSRKCNKGDEI
jgi:hypothetical protein